MLDELKSLLPTLASRLSLAATGSLLIPAFYTPVFLKPLLWPTISESDLVLLQLLSVLLELLVGLFVTFLCIRHAKEPKSFWESNP